MSRALALWWIIASATAADVRGWRNDGTNAYPEGAGLQAVDPAKVRWSVGLGAWANGSPVQVGDRICATFEPTGVVCVAADTGRELWRGTNDVVDALPAEAQPAVRAQIAEAAVGEVRLKELTRTYSGVQRDLRRSGGDPALTAQLAAITQEMETLKLQIDATAWYRTPPDKEIIGYASATPVTDGERIYTLYGNGVVSAWTIDGRRVWTRWLGPHRQPLRGYEIGTAASPRLVDGVLVVPWDALLGLDPATGTTRWEGRAYRDYGTPGVATVGGVGLVLTPDGAMVRAKDGAYLQQGVGDTWYIGPSVLGDVAYYVGTRRGAHSAGGALMASAVRLVPIPGGARPEPLWSVEVPVGDPFYAQPVIAGGRVVTVSSKGRVVALDAASGRLLGTHDLAAIIGDGVYASPVAVGDVVMILGAGGTWVTGRFDGTWTPVSQGESSTARATPLMAPGRAWIRTYEKLICFGP